jgi:16S rRNA (cytidine1402-2'-O)-methyltransferase
MSHDDAGSPELSAVPNPSRGETFPPLTLVATPIGNLGDLTFRAADALRSCDAVIAEDTRRASQLLAHLDVRKPLVSFHEHNEERRLSELIARLRSGERLALVTDAGTPSVSDPGFRLVRACVAEGIAYTVLPGASAVTTALVGSGLPPVPFFFGGFLPSSGSGRRSELRKGTALGMTAIYFESPHRLVACLEDLSVIAPGCMVCVSRELTKIHEEYRLGSPAELAAHYGVNPPRGEITLVIDPMAGKAAERKSAKDYSEKTPIPRNLA